MACARDPRVTHYLSAKFDYGICLFVVVIVILLGIPNRLDLYYSGLLAGDPRVREKGRTAERGDTGRISDRRRKRVPEKNKIH